MFVWILIDIYFRFIAITNLFGMDAVLGFVCHAWRLHIHRHYDGGCLMVPIPVDQEFSLITTTIAMMTHA